MEFPTGIGHTARGIQFEVSPPRQTPEKAYAQYQHQQDVISGLLRSSLPGGTTAPSFLPNDTSPQRYQGAGFPVNQTDPLGQSMFVEFQQFLHQKMRPMECMPPTGMYAYPNKMHGHRTLLSTQTHQREPFSTGARLANEDIDDVAGQKHKIVLNSLDQFDFRQPPYNCIPAPTTMEKSSLDLNPKKTVIPVDYFEVTRLDRRQTPFETYAHYFEDVNNGNLDALLMHARNVHRRVKSLVKEILHYYMTRAAALVGISMEKVIRAEGRRDFSIRDYISRHLGNGRYNYGNRFEFAPAVYYVMYGVREVTPNLDRIIEDYIMTAEGLQYRINTPNSATTCIRTAINSSWCDIQGSIREAVLKETSCTIKISQKAPEGKRQANKRIGGIFYPGFVTQRELAYGDTDPLVQELKETNLKLQNRLSNYERDLLAMRQQLLAIQAHKVDDAERGPPKKKRNAGSDKPNAEKQVNKQNKSNNRPKGKNQQKAKKRTTAQLDGSDDDDDSSYEHAPRRPHKAAATKHIVMSDDEDEPDNLDSINELDEAPFSITDDSSLELVGTQTTKLPTRDDPPHHEQCVDTQDIVVNDSINLEEDSVEEEEEDLTDNVFGGPAIHKLRCEKHYTTDESTGAKLAGRVVASDYEEFSNKSYYTVKYMAKRKYKVRQCEECCIPFFSEKPKGKDTVLLKHNPSTNNYEEIPKNEDGITFDGLLDSDYYKVNEKNKKVWICACAKTDKECSVGYCEPCFNMKLGINGPGTKETLQDTLKNRPQRRRG